MTVQAQELLEYKNEEFSLIGAPLKDFLKKNKNIKFEIFTTAHWRGYQGYWKIENEKLYLTKLESANYTFEEIFNSTEPILADWFSGILQFGFGYFKENHWWGNYENYLWIKIDKGIVIEKRIRKGIDNDYIQILNFGIYKNESVKSLIYGKITLNTHQTTINYIKAVINSFIEKNNNVILPTINITNEDYELIEKISTNVVTYEIFENTITTNSAEKEIAEQFSVLLEKVIPSVFLLPNTKFREMKKQNIEIVSDSILLDNDDGYLNWAIKNVPSFCYPPSLLTHNFNLKKLAGFKIDRISNIQFKIKAVTLDNQSYKFPSDTLKINQEKYEKRYSVYFDEIENEIFYDNNAINQSQEFQYYLNENFEKKIRLENYQENHPEDYEIQTYNDWLNEEFGDDAETAYWNLD